MRQDVPALALLCEHTFESTARAKTEGHVGKPRFRISSSKQTCKLASRLNHRDGAHALSLWLRQPAGSRVVNHIAKLLREATVAVTRGLSCDL
jgi:hypothetical protein